MFGNPRDSGRARFDTAPVPESSHDPFGDAVTVSELGSTDVTPTKHSRADPHGLTPFDYKDSTPSTFNQPPDQCSFDSFFEDPVCTDLHKDPPASGVPCSFLPVPGHPGFFFKSDSAAMNEPVDPLAPPQLLKPSIYIPQAVSKFSNVETPTSATRKITMTPINTVTNRLATQGFIYKEPSNAYWEETNRLDSLRAFSY